MQRGFNGVIWSLSALLCSSGAASQARLDRADPVVIERSLVGPSKVEDPSRETITSAVAPTLDPTRVQAPRIASAIIVEGATDLPPASFSDVIPRFIGRSLDDRDLRDLATAVSVTARDAGFIFATARIEPQRMSDGILRVRLDMGALSAVRVIGKTNSYADRILSRALVTGRGVHKRDLERAILLVGDIPGVSVKETKYIRQDGFGILLVTIDVDRASLYAQVDNRGSDEVGPLRSTLLASVRGVLQAGDELSFVSAQTPLAPSEFFFLRSRYTMPIDADGTTVSASAAYGKTRPGGILAPLEVVGESKDAVLNVTAPLVRTRRQSLWASVEMRALESTQTLLGLPLRNDRSAVVTVAATGAISSASSVVRGELAMSTGLPIAGVSRDGDPRTSRADGDARFVTLAYDFSFEKRATQRVSVVIASQGQVASRPLLASAEIGVGGPFFGRGYDYAERTGDYGVLASAEARYDIGRLFSGVVGRAQLYGSIDGGYVDNLGNGGGGGGLLSVAAGLRLTQGLFDASFEVALPVSSARFDTGTREPRISVKAARSF